MGVHDNVLMIIVVEEIVPHVGIEVEGVVEDKLDVRVVCLDKLSDVSVECLKKVDRGAPPWFVDRLDSGKSGVGCPFVEETSNGILGPGDVVPVVADVLAILVDGIILTHPLTEGGVPMVEVILIGPDGSVG